jgi:hypothetical protein
MSQSETESANNQETLQHLLGVVNESREKRCAEVRDNAHEKARETIGQAYTRARARLHRHVNTLRDKYRVRVTSAVARNLTLLRKQNQKNDRAVLDVAWPLLREALLAQWDDPQSRRAWLDAAVSKASSSLLNQHWHIEYPSKLDEHELDRIKKDFSSGKGKKLKLIASDDIEAGIRIRTHGTTVDASLEGLLHHRDVIEAELIARIKQGDDSNG